MASKRPKKYRRKDYGFETFGNGKRGRWKKTDMKRPCPSGKKSFASRGDALAAAPVDPDDVDVYECPDCGQLHLTHKVSRRVRQAMARGEIDASGREKRGEQ